MIFQNTYWILLIKYIISKGKLLSNKGMMTDLFVIQFLIIYTTFLLSQNNNLYYTLLYLFVEVLLVGFVLLTYQLDLFTGFLWIAEGTIVLIFILVLMYLNSSGFTKTNHLLLRKKVFIAVLLVVAYLIKFNYNTHEHQTYFLTELVLLWDDLYEAINNHNINDFQILFISYYNLNSLELVVFALLLFIGTLICVALFKNFYSSKLITYATFFSLFDFFNHKVQYNFLRQQNLNKQASAPASSRILRKK